MKTISQIFRQQVLAEGPQHEDARLAFVYVDATIDAMDNTELLDRISDAFERATSGKGTNP